MKFLLWLAVLVTVPVGVIVYHVEVNHSTRSFDLSKAHLLVNSAIPATATVSLPLGYDYEYKNKVLHRGQDWEINWKFLNDDKVQQDILCWHLDYNNSYNEAAVEYVIDDEDGNYTKLYLDKSSWARYYAKNIADLKNMSRWFRPYIHIENISIEESEEIADYCGVRFFERKG